KERLELKLGFILHLSSFVLSSLCLSLVAAGTATASPPPRSLATVATMPLTTDLTRFSQPSAGRVSSIMLFFCS
ncbi:hypothetical protein LINPERPRIM_LOCUS20212, partial [Linum perenne]